MHQLDLYVCIPILHFFSYKNIISEDIDTFYNHFTHFGIFVHLVSDRKMQKGRSFERPILLDT